jgi:hypothetical protein
METGSLFREALAEAERHKYIESQKAGRDLGHAAIDDWQRRHWTLWLRHRWIEHLLGTRCWEEFDPWRLSRLRVLFDGHMGLLNQVIALVLRGGENADILWWAATGPCDMAAVVRMLVELRLNEIRCTRQCFFFLRSACP